MISRKRILSNSCSHLSRLAFGPDDYDAWFDTDSLIKEHIQEVLDKCNQLDDEIWGKIICMERNRRIAKAYARSPVININGGDIGFDGDSIGLAGFDNPYRDADAQRIQRRIGSEGILVAADEDGNIILDTAHCRSRLLLTNGSNHLTHCPIALQNHTLTRPKYYHNHHHRQRQPPSFHFKSEVEQKSGVLLKFSRSHKIFDMKKFLKGMNQELLNQKPDDVSVSSLESQCISIVSFDVSSKQVDEELLETPVWIMIINVIALEMLHKNLQLIYHLNESTSGYSTSNLTSRFMGSGDDDDLTLHHKRSDLQSGSRNGMNKKSLRRGNSTLCQIKKPTHHFVRSRSNVDLNFDDDKNNTVRVGVRGGGGRSSLSSAGTLMLDNNRMTRNKKFQRQPFKGWPTEEGDEDNEGTEVLPTPDYDSESSDPYRIFAPIRRSLTDTRGFLNSVLRHLPLQATLSRDHAVGSLPTAYQESWRRLPGSCDDLGIPSLRQVIPQSTSNPSSSDDSRQNDSDESLTHIYSSICESSASGGGGNSSKNKRSKLKRTTTIPKTLRHYFLMIKRKDPTKRHSS